MPDINDLLQEKGRVVNEMFDLNTKAGKEERVFNSDEAAKYKRLENRLDDINASIARTQKIKENQKDMMARTGVVVSAGGYSSDESINELIASDAAMLERAGHGAGRTSPSIQQARARCSKTYIENFWLMQRRGSRFADSAIQNSLTIGSDPNGGHLVPVEYDKQLVVAKQIYNEIRNFATVQSTSSDLNIPVEASQGTAEWMTEEESYTESQPTFNRVVLSSHKLGRIMKVSEELLQDSFFDLPTYIAEEYGRSFGFAEEEAFINGDGTGKPNGIVPGAGSTTNAAGATGITADEVIDLLYTLPRPYRAKAAWLSSDLQIKNIRKLKDADGQYLWQPGLQADEPDRVLGKPVITSAYVPAPTTGNRSLVIGDLSYYRIADRLRTSMQRLDELFAATGQVGFRMYARTDGKVVLPEAFAALVQA